MRKTDWIKAARRRCSADLFLCKNRVQAQAVRVHPECYQIWDRAPDSHEPYFVIAIHQGGMPRDPSDFDIDILQGMSSDREHQGRKGWVDEIDRGGQERFDIAEEEYRARVQAHYAPGGRGYDAIRHLTGQGLVIAKTIPKKTVKNTRRGLLR